VENFHVSIRKAFRYARIAYRDKGFYLVCGASGYS
jgi:hypothetical protein